MTDHPEIPDLAARPTPIIPQQLLAWTRVEEGLVLGGLKKDREGWVFGYGHRPKTPAERMLARFCTAAIAEGILLSDLTEHWESVKFHFQVAMSEARRATLTQMSFQMGAAGLAGFVKTREFILHGDWYEASQEILRGKTRDDRSQLAIDTPQRAQRYAFALRQDEWPSTITETAQRCDIGPGRGYFERCISGTPPAEEDEAMRKYRAKRDED